jgi:tetratricopeptide (TPR) repeat protein
MYPNFPVGYRRLGQIYEQKAMYAEAITELERALALAPDDTETMSVMAHVYASWGRKTDAEVSLGVLNELSKRLYVSPYSRARIHMGLGQRDEAFEWLEKTFQERHGILVYLKVECAFDDIRDDPRYFDLLARMNLE